MDASSPRQPLRALKPWVLVPLLVLIASPGVMPLTREQRAGTPVESLPARLTDQEFWALSTAMSEPNGFFRSENLVSNEHTFQYVVPALQQSAKPGGVYLGVAPDQNFTYMLATRPAIAFIVDIRRGNLLEHLMYKAILELSADRAEFLSRLFARKRPANIGPKSSVTDLFRAFDQISTTEGLYRQNLGDIETHLTKRHGFALSAEDLQQLEGIYFSFFWDGPNIRYSSFPAGSDPGASSAEAAGLAATFPATRS